MARDAPSLLLRCLSLFPTGPSTVAMALPSIWPAFLSTINLVMRVSWALTYPTVVNKKAISDAAILLKVKCSPLRQIPLQKFQLELCEVGALSIAGNTEQ